MKTFFLALFLGFTSLGFAKDLQKSLPPFMITKQEALKPGATIATLRLEFNNPEFREMPQGYQQKVFLSINGVLETVVLDETFAKEWTLEPGKYIIKAWGGVGYYEIITDSLQFDVETAYTASVTFQSSIQPISVDKPVIYFSSPIDQAFELAVQPKGDFTFTYPLLENAWKGTVLKTGGIEIQSTIYPYLFWESNQAYQFRPSTNGFDVRKEQVVAFLEEKLNELGFTETEKTDFITYWGPKMTQHDRVFVQFETGSTCDNYASLNCTPAPNHINRVYVSFCPWNDIMSEFVKPTHFETLPRDGFTLLEWGGFSFEALIPTFISSTH